VSLSLRMLAIWRLAFSRCADDLYEFTSVSIACAVVIISPPVPRSMSWSKSLLTVLRKWSEGFISDGQGNPLRAKNCSKQKDS
jgi:hypothetical protein